MLFIVRRNSQLLGATTTVVEPGRKWPLPVKIQLGRAVRAWPLCSRSRLEL